MDADTTPGADGPMAAPEGCHNPIAYRIAMRARYKNDLSARQQMDCLARRLQNAQHHARAPITGPFAEHARDVLQLIREANAKSRGSKR